MDSNEIKLIESYNKFLSLIKPDIKNKNIFSTKCLFIISAILFLYGLLSCISDIDLITNIFNPILAIPVIFIALIIFIIAWKQKMKTQYDIKKNYHLALEESLNIKWDGNIFSDEDYEKMSKSEYKTAGFKYSEDHYDYHFSSTEKIIINNKVEAYLIQIDKLVGSDKYNIPHYIIDGWIIKKKININQNVSIKNIKEIIIEFNKKYDYKLKNNLEINIYNGYLYIYIHKFNLHFSYSKLINYKFYKEIYYKIKLIYDLSDFVCNSIINFKFE